MILNAAPAQPVPPSLLDTTSILVVNQFEAETISGKTGVSAKQFSDAIGVDTVIVTRGNPGPGSLRLNLRACQR